MTEQPNLQAWRYRCDECGDAVDPLTWTPTATETIDGDFEIHRFCSEACRDEWLTE